MTGRFHLGGKIALVTGAASGLGLAIATCFLEAGARGDAIRLDGDAAADRAATLGPEAAAIALDVASDDDWQQGLRAVEQRFGGLHILVNNAGICVTGSIEDLSLDSWRAATRSISTAVFLDVGMRWR